MSSILLLGRTIIVMTFIRDGLTLTIAKIRNMI